MLTEFGQELRMIRLACGDRIFDMAEKLGVSPAYISRLERGTTPLPDGIVDKLIAAYWLSPHRANQVWKALDRTKAQDTPSRKLDQYIVRFPDGMRGQLKKAAKENNRSLNAEIIARLEDYNDSQSNSNSLDEIRETLIKHDVKLDKLADMLGKLCEVKNANQTRT